MIKCDGGVIMYRGCIFDLDGTLLDTVASIAHCANEALSCFGWHRNPVENYKRYAGDGQIEMLRRSLYDAGDRQGQDLEKVLKEYEQLFEKGCLYQVTPYPGILELLEELKKRKIKIGVLSNKEHHNAIYMIETIFGKDYFDMVLGQRPSHEKKPSPQGVRLMLKEFGILPEECLYIGDTNTDMKTGKGAALYTIGVTWGFREEEELRRENADAVISRPLDILNFL